MPLKAARTLSAMSKATPLRISERSIQLASRHQRLCFFIPRTSVFDASLMARGFLGKLLVEFPRRRKPQFISSNEAVPFS